MSEHGPVTWEVQGLTDVECQMAQWVGRMRRLESRRQDLQQECGGDLRSDERGMFDDQIGAGGEMAFAKWANLYWSYSVNSFASSEHDVGDIEVRTTSKHHNNLLLRPLDAKKEKHNSPFVCVTGTFPVFRIHGWAMGRGVMVPKYWRDLDNGRDGCWIMPKDHLAPLFTLPIQRS